MYFFIKLGRHVNHGERMDPIETGGQRSKVKVVTVACFFVKLGRGLRSKVKVTMDIYGNKLVSTIETKPLCASWSNLADMLAMVRG